MLFFLNIKNIFKRIETLEKEKLLNFIPPTGSFILMNYNISDVHMALPFEVIHSLSFDGKDVKLVIKVESRMVRGSSYLVDEFHVKLILPQ